MLKERSELPCDENIFNDYEDMVGFVYKTLAKDHFPLFEYEFAEDEKSFKSFEFSNEDGKGYYAFKKYFEPVFIQLDIFTKKWIKSYFLCFNSDDYAINKDKKSGSLKDKKHFEMTLNKIEDIIYEELSKQKYIYWNKPSSIVNLTILFYVFIF